VRNVAHRLTASTVLFAAVYLIGHDRAGARAAAEQAAGVPVDVPFLLGFIDSRFYRIALSVPSTVKQKRRTAGNSTPFSGTAVSPRSGHELSMICQNLI
jgi:hypothetical protein